LSGKDSLTYLVASLSVETGIAPREFIEMDPVMLKMMLRVLEERAKAIKDASRQSPRTQRRN
jgi:hypothetical protein